MKKTILTSILVLFSVCGLKAISIYPAWSEWKDLSSYNIAFAVSHTNKDLSDYSYSQWLIKFKCTDATKYNSSYVCFKWYYSSTLDGPYIDPNPGYCTSITEYYGMEGSMIYFDPQIPLGGSIYIQISGTAYKGAMCAYCH